MWYIASARAARYSIYNCHGYVICDVKCGVYNMYIGKFCMYLGAYVCILQHPPTNLALYNW